MARGAAEREQSVPEYLAFCERTLRAERARADRCLHASTESDLRLTGQDPHLAQMRGDRPVRVGSFCAWHTNCFPPVSGGGVALDASAGAGDAGEQRDDGAAAGGPPRGPAPHARALHDGGSPPPGLVPRSFGSLLF